MLLSWQRCCHLRNSAGFAVWRFCLCSSSNLSKGAVLHDAIFGEALFAPPPSPWVNSGNSRKKSEDIKCVSVGTDLGIEAEAGVPRGQWSLQANSVGRSKEASCSGLGRLVPSCHWPFDYSHLYVFIQSILWIFPGGGPGSFPPKALWRWIQKNGNTTARGKELGLRMKRKGRWGRWN